MDDRELSERLETIQEGINIIMSILKTAEIEGNMQKTEEENEEPEEIVKISEKSIGEELKEKGEQWKEQKKTKITAKMKK